MTAAVGGAALDGGANAATRPPLRWPFQSPTLTTIWLVVAAIVVGIAIVPLVYTIDAAFYEETRVGLGKARSLAAIVDVYTGRDYLGFLWQALVLGTVVTAIAVPCGVALALLIARTDIGAKSWLELLVIMPMFMSPFTGLIAWVALGSARAGFVNVAITQFFRQLGLNVGPLFDIWSYGGVVFVMVLFFTPFVYLFTVGTLRGMDASLENAARTVGARPATVLLRITLPLAAPAIVASALLVFVLAIESYTIPGLVGSTAGFTVLPWRIYEDSVHFPVHRAHAAAAGTVLMWITMLGVFLQRRVGRRAHRYVTMTGKGHVARPLPLGRWRWAALGLLALYVLLADVLPFGALILSSFMKYSAAVITPEVLTLRQYADLFTGAEGGVALWNTVLLAVLSGSVCVLLGLLISYLDVRHPGRWAGALAFVGVIPLAIPGVVYGVGLLWVYLRTPLYGTIWILLLAYVAKFVPFGIMVTRSGILQIHRELEESARTVGAGSITVLWKIVVPLLKPVLIAVFFYIMLQSIKELAASALLYTQRGLVLSVLTWHHMDAGNYQFAAALGVVQTIMMIALVVITRAVFQVKLEKSFTG